MVKTEPSKWNRYGIIHVHSPRDRFLDELLDKLDLSYSTLGNLDREFRSTLCMTCGHLTELIMCSLFSLKFCKEKGINMYDDSVSIDEYLKRLYKDIETIKLYGKWDIDVELHIIKYHEDKRLKEEYIKRLPKHEQEKIRQLKIDKFERELEEMGYLPVRENIDEILDHLLRIASDNPHLEGKWEEYHKGVYQDNYYDSVDGTEYLVQHDIVGNECVLYELREN